MPVLLGVLAWVGVPWGWLRRIGAFVFRLVPVEVHRRITPRIEYLRYREIPLEAPEDRRVVLPDVKRKFRFLELIFVDNHKGHRRRPTLQHATVSGYYYTVPFTGKRVSDEVAVSWEDGQDWLDPLPRKEFSVTVGVRHDDDSAFYGVTLATLKTRKDDACQLSDGRYFLEVIIDGDGIAPLPFWFYVLNENSRFAVVAMLSQPTVGMEGIRH